MSETNSDVVDEAASLTLPLVKDQTVDGEHAPGQSSYKVCLPSWSLIGKGQVWMERVMA